MKKEDDGSQEWMDQMTIRRIRRTAQPSQTTRFLEINPEQVSDPVLKQKLLEVREAGLQAKERYLHTPHFGPAHLGGKVVDSYTAANIPVNADVDQMSHAISNRLQQYRTQTNEVDNTEQAFARLPGQNRNQAARILTELQQGRSAFPQYNLARLHETNNMFNGPQQPTNNQQQYQNCRLMEGVVCFRPLQTNNFGNTVVMARALGQINQFVASQEFIVKGFVNVYVIPPNQTMVDVVAIQNNPQLLTRLVEVISPPASGIGTLLVPEQAIGMNNRGQNVAYGQRTLLTDSNNRRVGNNNIQVPNNVFAKRTILKG